MRKSLLKISLLLIFIIWHGTLSTPQALAESSKINIHVLDAGYADSSFIQLPSGKKILVDTGSYESKDRVMQFLKEKNVSHLDLVVITHPHDNHYGGLQILNDNISIHELITSDLENIPEDLRLTYQALHRKNVLLKEARRGQVLMLEPNMELAFHHPDRLIHEPNADSLVLQITYQRTILLFPGDIPPAIQTELVFSNTLTKNPDWVLLPHHGGQISEEFFHLVENSIKVMSTGPHDTWKAPLPETVARFPQNLYRTDLEGDLFFTVEPGGSVKWSNPE
ncbi:MAG: MBL fold metallo-hydrolase [Candidatus Omnitrophica bacterium]|nr:MBL fold metallo-hydrolase [Candidatus Omnitrophota bacterium]